MNFIHSLSLDIAKTRKQILLILAVTFIFLSGCQQMQNHEDKIDSYLLIGSTCEPPCVFGIIPDKSSRENALSILKNLETESFGWMEIHSNNLVWNDYEGTRINFRIDDNIITKITFAPLNKFEEDILLEDIILKFGIPEGYDIELSDEGGGHFIDIYYPFLGVTAKAGNSGKSYKDDIFPEMEITRLVFINPNDTIEHFLQNFTDTFHTDGREPIIYSNEYFEWHGYGNFP